MATIAMHIAKLKIAQIDSRCLDQDLVNELRTNAAFVDTDESMNEFMILPIELLKIAENNIGKPIKADCINIVDSANELYGLVHTFDYLQIAYI